MSFAIKHNPPAHRFEARVDSHMCVLDYSLDGNVMTIKHTGVPSAVGGQGIASALVEAALTTARSKGWKVMPACSYTAVWMDKHDHFNDLRA
jgi:predicted GNAT family acetyltransferase